MVEFLDRLRKGLDKGVATVTVKSKEILETTQLRSQVKTLQDERQREIEELGNIVYTLHVQGKLKEGFERLEEKCKRVANLDQKIRDKEEEIRQVHLKAQDALGAAASPVLGECACGASIREGTKFCGGCGKPVGEGGSRPEAAERAGGTLCPQCATPLAAAARFCANCGAKIGAESY